MGVVWPCCRHANRFLFTYCNFSICGLKCTILVWLYYIYRMCRADNRSSACKISKQLVNFKILYLNDDFHRCIYFFTQYNSNIVNSLYNCTPIFMLEVCSEASNFKQINSQVTPHNKFDNSTIKRKFFFNNWSLYLSLLSHQANCYYIS